MDLSAVCEYQLEEIQKVFEGPYKEYHEQAQKWGRYTDPVPSPRPGSVSCPRRGRAHVLCSGALPSGLTAAPQTLPTPSASTTGTGATATPAPWSCPTTSSTSSRSTR